TAGAMPLDRPSGAPSLLALASPCRSARGEWRDAMVGAVAPRIILFVIDPNTDIDRRGNTAAAQRLRDLFALTTAEAATAVAAAGDGLPAVAQALGVTPGTARTHAKSAFAKMQVRGQVDLARLVARLRLVD
ncbi:MAG TPA: hypothetical protein VME41_14375, partial [Stellaceae bacterium]|nr:hypothetical protein [Stellaceae bacterium]